MWSAHPTEVLLQEMQKTLCADDQRHEPSLAELKTIIAGCSLSVARESDVAISDRYAGQITGIVANLFEKADRGRFCSARSLSDLK